MILHRTTEDQNYTPKHDL